MLYETFICFYDSRYQYIRVDIYEYNVWTNAVLAPKCLKLTYSRQGVVAIKVQEKIGSNSKAVLSRPTIRFTAAHSRVRHDIASLRHPHVFCCNIRAVDVVLRALVGG